MAEENSNVLTNHYDKKKIIQFFVIMVVTAIVWNLPIDTFGMTAAHHRAATHHCDLCVRYLVVADGVYSLLGYIARNYHHHVSDRFGQCADALQG